MRHVQVQNSFEEWRDTARTLLRLGVPPDDVLWDTRSDHQPLLGGLADEFESAGHSAAPDPALRVPKTFLEEAHAAVCHSSPGKWPLLYRMLWRLQHGEPKLMENPADADALALDHLQREVRKDVHRMRAFLRFRETRLEDQLWMVAWYEPEHHTLRLNETFFVDRYVNLQWSILTPDECMHWDGQEISYSPGVAKSAAPTADIVEPLWITYYSTVFNPARAKRSAMQAQMPKRHWKNLPESAAIEPLLQHASGRAESMLARSERLGTTHAEFRLAQPPPGASLEQLRESAAVCQACPLYKSATCTVFGEGPPEARVVLVGEQPGDQEDREGRPFVGPAGKLLDRALNEAGLDRSTLYATNAVKHFKWEPRGKRRLHKTPNAREIAACQPWLAAELLQIRPTIIVALGGTAAKALFDQTLRITEERGKVLSSRFGPTLVTLHPSALLRLPDPTSFESEFDRFVADLKLAALP